MAWDCPPLSPFEKVRQRAAKPHHEKNDFHTHQHAIEAGVVKKCEGEGEIHKSCNGSDLEQMSQRSPVAKDPLMAKPTMPKNRPIVPVVPIGGLSPAYPAKKLTMPIPPPCKPRTMSKSRITGPVTRSSDPFVCFGCIILEANSAFLFYLKCRTARLLDTCRVKWASRWM